jgi:hypothetical protein
MAQDLEICGPWAQRVLIVDGSNVYVDWEAVENLAGAYVSSPPTEADLPQLFARALRAVKRGEVKPMPREVLA